MHKQILTGVEALPGDTGHLANVGRGSAGAIRQMAAKEVPGFATAFGRRRVLPTCSLREFAHAGVKVRTSLHVYVTGRAKAAKFLAVFPPLPERRLQFQVSVRGISA